MDVAISKNKVSIRLTQERWHHISTGILKLQIIILKYDHSEMTEDEIIIRSEQEEMIGFTILNASTR